MYSAISIQKYLALNRGRYKSEVAQLPKIESSIYVTTHFETAATDLNHYHEIAHLSFILNGGAVDKRKSNEHEKVPGEIMFFQAGEPHQTFYKEFPCKNINIELGLRFFKDFEIDETEMSDTLMNTPNTKFSILKIYKELFANDEFSNSSIEMLLLNLTVGSKGIDRYRPSWLTKIVELLHDRWNEEVSITDLVNLCGVHPKTISKYFPRYFNCTLGEYRRGLKIDKALSLIKTTDLSLSEIALECGFYDQSHFTGVFKRLTDFRPKQFKKL